MRRLDEWDGTSLLRRVHLTPIRPICAGPASWDVVVDSCSVQTKRGGVLTDNGMAFADLSRCRSRHLELEVIFGGRIFDRGCVEHDIRHPPAHQALPPLGRRAVGAAWQADHSICKIDRHRLIQGLTPIVLIVGFSRLKCWSMAKVAMPLTAAASATAKAEVLRKRDTSAAMQS